MGFGSPASRISSSCTLCCSLPAAYSTDQWLEGSNGRGNLFSSMGSWCSRYPIAAFVKTTVEGLRGIFSKPTQKKEPITTDMLKAMVQDTTEHSTLSNVRLTTACLLAFAGFLRFNELVNIRPCDLSFSDDLLKLFLPQSKTNQL